MHKLMVLLASCLSMAVFAQVERINLPFNDEVHSGDSEVYLLDKIMEVKPDFSSVGKKLKKVVLVAKSSSGTGTAQVKSGIGMSEILTVPGTPGNFGGVGHYYNLTFNNLTDEGAEGDWQLLLNGDISIQKMTLFVEQGFTTPDPTPAPEPTPWPEPTPGPSPEPTPWPEPTPSPEPEPTPWPTPEEPATITRECKYKLVTFWGKKVKSFKATHTGPSYEDIQAIACSKALSQCQIAMNAAGGVLKCELSD